MSTRIGRNTDKGTRLENAGLLAKGTAASIVGLISYSGLQYLFLVVVARALGPALYGLFHIGLATVNVAVPLALLGLNFAALRYVARYRAVGDGSSETRLVRRSLLLVATVGTFVSAGLVFLAEPIARFYGQNAGHDFATLVALLRWFAPAVPLSAALILLVSVFYGQKRIAAGVASQKIGQPALALLLAWPVLSLGAGVTGVVQSYVISLMLALLLALYWLRPTFLPAGQPATPSMAFSMRPVLAFSLPLAPVSFVRHFSNRLEIYLLGFLGTAAEVGLFSAVVVTAAFVVLGLKAILGIYSALAAELHADHDPGQLEYHLQLATRWSASLSLPPLLIIGLFGRDLLSLFSEGFVVGYVALLIVAVGQFANAATGPIDATLNMAGYSRLFLFNNVTILAVNVALDWWLINQWGLAGAAIGSTLSLIALNAVLAFEVKLLLGIRAYSRQLLRPFLAGVLTVITAWSLLPLLESFSPLPRLFIGSILIALLYCLLFSFFVPEEDRDVIKLVWFRVKSLVVSL